MTYCILCPFFDFSEYTWHPTSMQFNADECLPLKSYGWSVFLCLFLPVTQAVSIPLCTMLDLQLSFYYPLCYNSRAHCPLLQCVCTTSAILAVFFLWYDHLNVRGTITCHDLILSSPLFMYDFKNIA